MTLKADGLCHKGINVTGPEGRLGGMEEQEMEDAAEQDVTIWDGIQDPIFKELGAVHAGEEDFET